MTQRRAIGERLKRASSLALRRQIAHDWLANWLRDYDQTLRRLETALQRGSIGEAGQLLSQLKALNDKRFGAMPNLIDKLCDEDIV